MVSLKNFPKILESYIPYICILLLAVASILNARRIRHLNEEIEDANLMINLLKGLAEQYLEDRERLSGLEVSVDVETTKIKDRIDADIADVTKFCEKRLDALVEDIRALQLWKIEASELIEAHAELEKEAANSERLFQEGLSNLLNYGVDKK